MFFFIFFICVYKLDYCLCDECCFVEDILLEFFVIFFINVGFKLIVMVIKMEYVFIIGMVVFDV